MAIFLFLILSSYATEVIGIHAPFGALWWAQLCQMCLNSEWFYRKVEDVAVILLLPLFVFTGLKTEVGLINDAYLWKVTCYNYCGGCR
jgi:Kef-type K+ transport system membrane component KefB